MVGRLAPIPGSDRKNEVFKQRPLVVAHQVSGQADLHSRYQLESRRSPSVNPFCQHVLRLHSKELQNSVEQQKQQAKAATSQHLTQIQFYRLEAARSFFRSQIEMQDMLEAFADLKRAQKEIGDPSVLDELENSVTSLKGFFEKVEAEFEEVSNLSPQQIETLTFSTIQISEQCSVWCKKFRMRTKDYNEIAQRKSSAFKTLPL